MNKNNRWNFPKIVFCVFLVVFLCLYIQYAYLSLSPSIYGTNMDEFASKRSTYEKIISAKRGSIFDRDSNALAINVSSYTVIAYLDENRSKNSSVPLHVVNKESTAESLAPILNMDKKYILELLNRDSDPEKKVKQVELGPGGRGITELKKEEIENLNLPGIDFIEAQKRYYPNGNFASYILGYAKTTNLDTDDDGKEDTEEIQGELGIELKYNDLLKGTDGYIKYQKDRFGYKIPDTKEEKVPEQNGSDIYLTIDSNIQRFAESAIKEEATNYKPEWMFVTVMDAKTGDILASSSSPSFDPNVRDISNYENPLSSYIYEPGSTMKTYTYMCAIEKGTYDGTQSYKSGSIVVDNQNSIVSDWNPEGWGNLTYDQGYAYSSNVAITNITKTFINKGDLKDCFTKYGFGKQTGIELSRELAGTIEFNYPLEVATAGFGQGITTTPIQHLQALSIIANKGIMIKPHIISKIVNSNTNEVTYSSGREELGQIVSQKTVDKMMELMDNAVNASWAPTSAAYFKMKDVNVIGKSGTAQIFNTSTKQYETGDNNYIFSFSGIFPKEDPQIIIYAAMKKPSYGGTMGIVKATNSVMENIVKYLQMSNNKENDLKNIEIDYYTNKDIETLENLKKDLNVVIMGEGKKIIKQYPTNGSLIKGDKLFIVTNNYKNTMPNLIGYSKRDASTLLNLLGVSYEMDGYGYIISQSVKEGSYIDDTVQLKLSNKNYMIKIKEEEEKK